MRKNNGNAQKRASHGLPARMAAFVMAFIMLVSMVNVPVYAQGGGQGAGIFGFSVKEEQAEQKDEPTAETEAATEAAEAEVAETQAETQAAEASETKAETEAVVETQAETPEQEPADVPAEEPADEISEAPAPELLAGIAGVMMAKADAGKETDLENGLKRQTIKAIVITDPELSGMKAAASGANGEGTSIFIHGLLPEGGRVEAYPVSVDVPGQTVLAAFDITIYDADGNVFQPEEAVNVNITDGSLNDAETVSIYHMENMDAEAEYVADASALYGSVAFRAAEFSIYIIGEEDVSHKVNYRFWWSQNDINNNDPLNPSPYRVISLKNGESLMAPADPADETRGKFIGWYQDESAFSCDGVTAAIAEDATEDINIDIYADFDKSQYATFQSLYIDMKRTVFYTAALEADGSGYKLNLANVPPYGAPVGYKFLGWSLTQPTDPLGYGENIPKGSYYAPDSVITGLTGSVMLYPVVKHMYEVAFNGNGGLVNGLPVLKLQVTKDDTWEDVLGNITTVERSGHSRNNGWWDGPDNSASAVTLSGATNLTADKMYYAHWTATTTTVEVKYWKQAVNASEPYSLITEEAYTVKTGSIVELGKQIGSDVSRTHVLFHDPDDSSQDQEIDISNQVDTLITSTDSELKYFDINSISSADPDGNRHSSSPSATDNPYGRTFTVAEDGSTVVNVWINRRTYRIQFHFHLDGALGVIYYGTGRKNINYGPYTIKLGQDISSIWPDLTADNLAINLFGFGYTPVALGQRTNESNYPNAVSSIYKIPLSFATSDLLELANNSGLIELYGRYNDNTVQGGIRRGTIYEYRQNPNGTYTRSNAINYYFGRGTNQSSLEPFTSQTYVGYNLDVTQTLNANTNVYRKQDNGDGTVTIVFTRNGSYTVNLYYNLETYAVNLQHGDTILASGTDIKYTQPVKAYLQSNDSTSNVFADPTEAAGVPDYMLFSGWYTDEEFSENYALKDTNTMPYKNISLFAKFTPKPVTVYIDNGIKQEGGTAGITVDNPALNLSGSEMGGSVEYLNYTYLNGTTDVPYRAHENTIAEFLPTYWVTPVWENHVFTGWTIREKNAAGEWGIGMTWSISILLWIMILNFKPIGRICPAITSTITRTVKKFIWIPKPMWKARL